MSAPIARIVTDNDRVAAVAVKLADDGIYDDNGAICALLLEVEETLPQPSPAARSASPTEAMMLSVPPLVFISEIIGAMAIANGVSTASGIAQIVRSDKISTDIQLQISTIAMDAIWSILLVVNYYSVGAQAAATLELVKFCNANLAVFETLESLNGLGPPDPGRKFNEGNTAFSIDILDILKRASPDRNEWSGPAANNYREKNNKLQDYAREFAKADLRIAQELSRQASHVQKVRTVLSGIKLAYLSYTEIITIAVIDDPLDALGIWMRILGVITFLLLVIAIGYLIDLFIKTNNVRNAIKKAMKSGYRYGVDAVEENILTAAAATGRSTTSIPTDANFPTFATVIDRPFDTGCTSAVDKAGNPFAIPTFALPTFNEPNRAPQQAAPASQKLSPDLRFADPTEGREKPNSKVQQHATQTKYDHPAPALYVINHDDTLAAPTTSDTDSKCIRQPHRSTPRLQPTSNNRPNQTWHTS